MSSRRATRSRGSNCPRRSNSGFACADFSRARASSARSVVDQRQHVRAIARERLAVRRRSWTGWRATSYSSTFGLRRQMKSVERLRRAPLAPARRDPSSRLSFGTAPSMRMHEPEMNAAAGDSRNTIAAEISDSVPSRPSGTLSGSERMCSRHRGRILVEPRRRDPARRHRVDAHRRPFERGGLGEVEHAGARRARMAHAGHAVPHVGDHVHDRAAVLLHPLRVGLARHQEAAGEVGAHHRVQALRRRSSPAARRTARPHC